MTVQFELSAIITQVCFGKLSQITAENTEISEIYQKNSQFNFLPADFTLTFENKKLNSGTTY